VDEKIKQIIELVGGRAANIYTARGYCCSEAVICTMNKAFGGELSDEMAARLGSGFCHGMGGAGCACGSLAGGEIGLSLYLSHRGTGGIKKKQFEKLAKEMHDRFKERFHATCCRLLIKRRKEKKGASCVQLTQGAAEIATSLLLETRPKLAEKVDLDFLQERESKAGNMARKLLGRG